PSGGRATLRKSTHATSTKDSSINSSIDTEKRRSKPSCSCSMVFRNRELDGRRNSLARKSSAVEKDHKIIRARTHCDFPRDKVRRPQILANTRPRFLRSATHLADPSKMETRRDLSDSPHTFAPCYCRRPHHSLVPKMPKIVAFTPLRERRFCENRSC